MRKLDIAVEAWPIAGSFTISRGSRTEAVVVVVRLEENGISGEGECVPYARYGETIDSVVAQIESVRPALQQGLDRGGLLAALAPGAARNAIDCALFDLETKCAGTSLRALCGTPSSPPILTAYTLSLGTPEAMYEAARKSFSRPLLKIKLGGEGDAERLAAVREGAPQARLIVDANEAWRDHLLQMNIAACEKAGVELIEQPLPAGEDQALSNLSTGIAICADESIHDSKSLDHLPPWYSAINIKLDKTGGLTDALVLHRQARERQLKTMVGCMLGTSLAMRPALLLAQDADFVDLDGPLLLAKDREKGLRYEGSYILPA